MSTPTPPLTERPSAQPVLAVALETLVRTDVVLEAAFAQVRRAPQDLLRVVVWRMAGRRAFAERLAHGGAFEPSALPFDEALLERLRAEHAAGRTIVLIAQSGRTLAEAVAAHLGIFSQVMSPEGGEAVPTGCERAEATPVPNSRRIRALIRALRPHQWTKNALVFAPVLLAHAVTRGPLMLQAVWAFAAFCLCASSVYVLNDLLDLHADRAHHHKRTRPFASGELPLGAGLAIAPVLLLGACAIATRLSHTFVLVLGAYYAATLAYSLYLKRVVLLDVLLLAGLYTARIIAGGVATEVAVSQWLLAFSMFIFLSLAFVKRYSEVHTLRKKGVEEAKGRGYRASDLEQLSSLGASAGFISVLVLALYVSSADVTKLYAHPARLWGILPLFLYWISRVWLLAHRGQMHDDPIVFAIRDRASYVIAALVAAVVWLSI
ncbi:MAG: UbiA family prenyltransferase [Myxococcaceae bacterium]|nr:UbiA family prenyltransferase [Myxococcaceae bacterium]